MQIHFDNPITEVHSTNQKPSPLPLGGNFRKTIGVPPFTGEMSEGQRGPLRDDQANNAADKSFAKVSSGGDWELHMYALGGDCVVVFAASEGC